MSMFIEVYKVDSCPECDQVRYLLKHNGLFFREIDLTNGYVTPEDYQRFERTRDADGRLAVPRVFVDNKLLGGRVELAMFLKSLDRSPLFAVGTAPELRRLGCPMISR